MAELLNVVLYVVIYVSLMLHLIFIGIAVWKIWRGENIVDRLVGADLIGTLTMAVIILVAIYLRNSIYIDVALGLAALSFISVFAYAKYAADQRVF
jgi:multisubunit Na+/H+ antiporter MnhF subunit